MKKKERNRRRPEAYKAMRARIIALTLILWLTCMGFVTWAAAAEMYQQILTQARTEISTGFGAADIPGQESHKMLSRIHYSYHINLKSFFPFMLPQTPKSYGSDDWFWNEMELLYGYEPATVFYDESGQLLIQNGDYMFFEYTTTESDPEDHSPEPQGYGYIDLNDPSEEMLPLRDFMYQNRSGGLFDRIAFFDFRMTGWFEGGQFHPVSLYTLIHGLDMENQVFSAPAEFGKELVTIYTRNINVCTRSTTPVTVGGVQFDSLPELLDAHIRTEENYRSDNLFNAVIIVTGSHAYSNYKVAQAYRCSPMGYAALRLIPFYLVSLAILLIVLKLILRNLRKNLTAPLDNIIVAAACNAPLTPAAKWEELYSLEQQYSKFQQSLSEKNTELQQLRTKLDYAQNAETNRRQLVSGLTHELKTPLAVIHSYAEGLKDGIAEEKKDHYLSVILEQSEKMDSMVLQMLDLSRLEAGKVRLSSDNFSLLALTKTVVDRFSPMLEEKGLSVSFGVAQEFLITADQARIEQVITNLVSNALKYTEPENRISISVFQHNGKAGFSIENPGKWLPEEALEKVWDSFFRVDPSRTAPGTGLGLAVVKQIIQLHQGSCKAHNTLYKNQDGTFPGVQFSFQIPMG